MVLPPSFIKSGFPETFSGRKYRRLMVGIEGLTDTGKTEFCLSGPGPVIGVGLDRGYEGCLDNPSPPPSRASVYAFKAVKVPLASQLGSAVEYMPYWKEFYSIYKAALDNPDARTAILDGDSDSWELQRLAEFGTLTNVKGVPGLAYTGVNQARRAMLARAYDSGKTFFGTDKVKPEYADKLDEKGQLILKDGKEVREKTGNYERQGFSDTDYMWQVRLLAMRPKPATYNRILKREIPMSYGIKILKCKQVPSLVGQELWGADCTFSGLVQLMYPDVPLSEWGYK